MPPVSILYTGLPAGAWHRTASPNPRQLMQKLVQMRICVCWRQSGEHVLQRAQVDIRGRGDLDGGACAREAMVNVISRVFFFVRYKAFFISTRNTASLDFRGHRHAVPCVLLIAFESRGYFILSIDILRGDRIVEVHLIAACPDKIFFFATCNRKLFQSS